MKKIISIIVTIVLILFLTGRIFATDVVTDLETETTLESELETELSTDVPEPELPIESDTVEPQDTVDPGLVDSIKNTLTTVLEHSEKIQTVYYIVCACSAVVNVIVLIIICKKNKKHNSEVTKEVGERVGILYSKQVTDSIVVIEETVKPVFEQLYKTQEAVVKSIALQHLKDDKSAVASLECLSEVLSDDARRAVNEIKHTLKTRLSVQEENRKQIEKDLTNLVEKAEKEISGGRTFIQDLSKRIL